MELGTPPLLLKLAGMSGCSAAKGARCPQRGFDTLPSVFSRSQVGDLALTVPSAKMKLDCVEVRGPMCSTTSVPSICAICLRICFP